MVIQHLDLTMAVPHEVQRSAHAFAVSFLLLVLGRYYYRNIASRDNDTPFDKFDKTFWSFPSTP
jgi:hypothetical protein